MNAQTLETQHHLRRDSDAWLFFVKVSFMVALCGMIAGIVLMPVDLWVRGYMVLGTLFLVGSTFTLAKTVRDGFEDSRLINQLSQARTEKLLKEYGVKE